jgi:hypothetical protein
MRPPLRKREQYLVRPIAAALICSPVRRSRKSWRSPRPGTRQGSSALCSTLDGEAVVCGPDGVAVFDALRRRGTVTEAMLYAFDLLELDGEDLRSLPLGDRGYIFSSMAHWRSALPECALLVCSAPQCPATI